MESEEAEVRLLKIEEKYELGRRIAVHSKNGGETHSGTVAYFGKLKHEIKKETKNVNYKDDYLGIAWDDPTRGKHTGTVKGHTYFTAEASGGLIPPAKADFGIDLYTGILKKYFKGEYKEMQEQKLVDKFGKIQDEGTKEKEKIVTEFDDDAYFETVQKIKKKVEFVGFNRIWKQINNLNKILGMSLPDLCISSVGHKNTIGKMLPNLQVLSLERNLIFDWNQVYLIGRELPKLQHLALSRNRLMRPADVTTMKGIFVNADGETLAESPVGLFKRLEILVLVGMGLDWAQVSNVIPAFPNIKELILKENKCTDFENIRFGPKDLPNLNFLNIETNGLTDFSPISKHFQEFASLEKLNINYNQIKLIGEFSGFTGLKSLSIDKNAISEIKAV